MGFGAYITSGPGFTPLPDEVMRFAVEARIEQELSRPAAFAIRFEDDLCDGGKIVADRDELKANTLLAVFVKAAERWECLVHGPITRVRTSSMVGGAGSWVEVSGQDRRAEMDRVGLQASFTGKASAVARSLLGQYGFEADCEETRKEYAEGTDALNQRGTDLAFVTDIARRNNLEFWLGYATEVDGPPAGLPLPGGPPAFRVTVTANLKSSPSRGAPSAAPLPPLPPVLAPDTDKTIRITPPPGQCVSVNRFDVRIDYDRATAVKAHAQATDGRASEEQAQPPDAQLDQRRGPPAEVAGVTREALAPPVTDPEEARLAAEAQATEQAWFVEVDASATLEQLGFVVQPHDIVAVANVEPRLAGPYQVKAATHVINAADHFIDFKLRANGLPVLS